MLTNIKIKTHCIFCENRTNHIIIANTEDFEIKYADQKTTEYESYNIVQCLGCDQISFLHLKWDENSIGEFNEFIKREYNYPEDLDFLYSEEFLSYDDINFLPSIVSKIYEEVKVSFINEAYTLCGIGIRTIIEAVCLNKKITGRNLQEKINSLVDEGHISKNEHQILDRLREIGNISAHKIISPSEADLEAALEATNHLLRAVYIVNQKTKRLQKNKNLNI